jgi:hypothetical protein
MYGLLPNGSDMLYLPNRGVACDGYKISNNDFECGAARRFDMTFYTTNMYNYASNYASNPLDVMLRFKEKNGEKLKIIYFSSSNIISTLPIFNKKSYDFIKKLKNNSNESKKIELYEQFWKIIHTQYDVMIISNFVSWDRASFGENVNQLFPNNDSFQINFTNRGIKKILIDKIYVNPIIFSPNKTWLDIKKYRDIETIEQFKQFITNNKLLHLLDKDVKFSDFKFSNIPTNLENIIETFDPTDQNSAIKLISNKGESVNLTYERFSHLFDNYKKVKNIPNYNHLF